VDSSLGKVKGERKDKICGCIGIKYALSLKDAGRTHFCAAGKGKMGKKGKEGEEERDSKPLYLPIF